MFSQDFDVPFYFFLLVVDTQSDKNEGSDIESDFYSDFDNVDVPEDLLDRDQWLRELLHLES